MYPTPHYYGERVAHNNTPEGAYAGPSVIITSMLIVDSSSTSNDSITVICIGEACMPTILYDTVPTNLG